MRNQIGSEPMCKSHVTMSLVPQRSAPRWKEWLPLISQQQRLRNLLQVMAYNVPSERGTKVYYTLHVTSMSAPFYTSEKLHHPNPKWVEVESCILANSVNTAATGMVVRLWQCKEGDDQDSVLLIWGLYMSGLIYLGPSLSQSGAQFRDCAIVLHMFGGFFTASQWLQQPISRFHLRLAQILIPATDVRPSYNVQRLLRLRIFQQNIKKQNMKADELRKRIISRGFGFLGGQEQLYPHETNPAVRKILNRTRPKTQTKTDTLPIRRQIEIARCRVALLQNEKTRKMQEVQNLQLSAEKAADGNSARSLELQERYQELHRSLEELRDRQRRCSDLREALANNLRLLTVRRRELMSQLNAIYPIDQQQDGKFTIRGIHLPNSEELSGSDDIQVSVALGFVTHVVQMLSIFLQVPLLYPLINFGSRSKIVDNISEKISDREREFPLFLRGKDKQNFNYGVFLLNKNIAQLRWLCGLPTYDLRPTLRNLYALLRLNTILKGLDSHKRSLSGSSLDMISISANASPVGSFGGHLPALPNAARPSSSSSYHSAKSVSSSEQLYPPKNGTALRLNQSNMVPKNGTALRLNQSNMNSSEGMGNGTNLSYSLDKGLDEYGEIQKAEESKNGKSGHSLIVSANTLSHVGSEPILSASSWRKDKESDEQLSDDDHNFDRDSRTTIKSNDKSEFELVTERIVQLVDSSRTIDDNEMKLNETDETASKPRTVFPKEETSEKCRERSCSDSEAIGNGKRGEVDQDIRSGVSNEEVSEVAKCTKTIADTVFANVTSRTEADTVLANVTSRTEADTVLANVTSRTEADTVLANLTSRTEADTVLANVTSRTEADTVLANATSRTEADNVLANATSRTEADTVFANVTSRTEALASHSTSFNLMGSRHGGSS